MAKLDNEKVIIKIASVSLLIGIFISYMGILSPYQLFFKLATTGFFLFSIIIIMITLWIEKPKQKKVIKKDA